jgi:NaMN:DMB phosphoribosyltransferase
MYGGHLALIAFPLIGGFVAATVFAGMMDAAALYVAGFTLVAAVLALIRIIPRREK